MKRLVSFAVLVVAVAATAYGLTCYLNSQKTEDQWTWLRREFRLSDSQFARIKNLHQAYLPVCAGHCQRIMAMQQRMADLERTGAHDAPSFAAARAEWNTVKQECNEATLQHLREVAAVMDPDAGRRYLGLTVPRIAKYDHLEPREIR